MESNKKKIFNIGLIGNHATGSLFAKPISHFIEQSIDLNKRMEEEKHQKKMKGEISISLDFNNVDASINFQELKIFENDMNQTLNFKVKKQKSDFHKRIKKLQNSIK